MAGTQPKKKAKGKAYQLKCSFRSFACTTERIKRRTRWAMKASRWHKEKARTLRESEPSRWANGVVVTHIQQGVQHSSKYGGMAGTIVEEMGSWHVPYKSKPSLWNKHERTKNTRATIGDAPQ